MSTETLLIDDPAFAGWWWLARAYHSIVAALHPFFEEWGITGAQFGVLRCLSDAGPDGLMLSDLSKRLMVTCGNTTGVVDRLEQAGYLRRERKTDDRRIVMARLTPQGAELFARIQPAHLALVQGLMDGLTTEEKLALASLCGTLHHSLETAKPGEEECEPAPVRRK